MQADHCIHKGCKGTVTGEEIEVHEQHVTQEVTCDWCDAQWTLVFTLTDTLLDYEGDGPRRECDACEGSGLTLDGDWDCLSCGGLGHQADGIEY